MYGGSGDERLGRCGRFSGSGGVIRAADCCLMTTVWSPMSSSSSPLDRRRSTVVGRHAAATRGPARPSNFTHDERQTTEARALPAQPGGGTRKPGGLWHQDAQPTGCGTSERDHWWAWGTTRKPGRVVAPSQKGFGTTKPTGLWHQAAPSGCWSRNPAGLRHQEAQPTGCGTRNAAGAWGTTRKPGRAVTPSQKGCGTRKPGAAPASVDHVVRRRRHFRLSAAIVQRSGAPAGRNLGGAGPTRPRTSRRANNDGVTCFVTLADC